MAKLHHSFMVVATLLAPFASACLPQDERPPPASLLVTASGSQATQQGFETDDGWHIQFTRFIVSIGHADFTKSDACTTYSDANYERVLDLLQPGAQKVNLIHGLGSCNLEFRVAYPNSNSLAGLGVTEQDITFMRTQFSDRYTSLQGINGYISGAARKEGRVKVFTWAFRQNWYYSSCRSEDGQLVSLSLAGGAQESVELSFYGERLFQDVSQPDLPRLAFEPMAQADSATGNDDGDVSLDELGRVNVALGSLAGTPPPYTTVTDAGATTDLQSLVYMGLFPRMVRYADAGPCMSTATRPGRN